MAACSRWCWGLPPLPDHSLLPEPLLQHGGAAIGAGGMTGILFSLGASMVLGGVAQMLAPKARTPRTQTTDNGKQNTYFSSLDNMVAQGNVLPVLYGEMRVGSRVASQEISTADEGDGGQVVVIGR